jgi:hypothetical protein
MGPPASYRPFAVHQVSSCDVSPNSGASNEAQAVYHLTCETMIGLALGRATTQGNVPLSNERTVINHSAPWPER